MVTMWTTVYKQVFDERFKAVYSEKGKVEQEDMVVSYEALLYAFMDNGRTEKRARKNVRELMEYNSVSMNEDRSFNLLLNPYGVSSLSGLYLSPDGEKIIPKMKYVREGSHHDYREKGTKVEDNEIRSYCCYTMQNNYLRGNVKMRYGKLSIYGTKILVCPWCGVPVIYRKSVPYSCDSGSSRIELPVDDPDD